MPNMRKRRWISGLYAALFNYNRCNMYVLFLLLSLLFFFSMFVVVVLVVGFFSSQQLIVTVSRAFEWIITPVIVIQCLLIVLPPQSTRTIGSVCSNYIFIDGIYSVSELVLLHFVQKHDVVIIPMGLTTVKAYDPPQALSPTSANRLRYSNFFQLFS